MPDLLKNFPLTEDKWWSQILAICIAGMGCFSTGLAVAWSSPYALAIAKDEGQEYGMTEEDTSYFIIAHPLGVIAGSFFFFQIAEYLGRKKSILALPVPHITCWIITIFARNKWAFYAARFISGMSETVQFCSIPPYIGEITTPTVRGYWGNFPTVAYNVGNLSITIIGSYLNVRTSAYICIGVPIIYFILVAVILPESPYQLIRRERYDEARKSIRWLRRQSDVEKEFFSMKADVERQMSERGNWKDLVMINSNRRALVAGLFLRFSQTMSGIAVFSNYTQVIFQKAGGSFSPQYSSMIFVGVLCVLLAISGPLVESLGRKRIFFWSLLSCSLTLILLGVYFYLDRYNLVPQEQLGWIPLAGMVTWEIVFTPGLGVVPTLMLGELFSSSIKSKGICALIAAFGIGVVFSTYTFNQLSSDIGFYAPFWFYGAVCVVLTALSLKLVPETKGKTLEQIQQELKK